METKTCPTPLPEAGSEEMLPIPRRFRSPSVRTPLGKPSVPWGRGEKPGPQFHPRASCYSDLTAS